MYTIEYLHILQHKSYIKQTKARTFLGAKRIAIKHRFTNADVLVLQDGECVAYRLYQGEHKPLTPWQSTHVLQKRG